MTGSATRWTRYPVIALGLVLLAATACQGGAPEAIPTPAPTESPAALPTEAPPTEKPPPTAAPDTPPEASAAAPGTILVQQSGDISAAEETTFRVSFDGVAQQAIRIDATLLEGAVDYELRLIDMFGNFIASIHAEVESPTETISEFTLPYDGTYDVEVAPFDGLGTVEVTVTALDTTSGGGILSGPGKSLPGLISTRGTYHTYQFPLTEGDVVRIAAVADVNGSPDPRLTLYGPDGSFITEVDDLEPEGMRDLNAVLTGFIVEQTGTYTAIVSNYGDTAGSYAFSVELDTTPPEATGPADVVYDRDYLGEFADLSTLEATFDGERGDVLRIEVFDVAADLDIDASLVSPFGQTIAYAISALTGEDETLSEVQLPYSGRYTIQLSPIGFGQASFRIVHLTVDDLTGGGSFGDDMSGTRSGEFKAPNTWHTYQFNARAGDVISLIVRSLSDSGTLDIGFALLGPSGLELTFADDTDESLDPDLLDYTLPQTGTYTVIVYAFGDATGTYDLDFTRR